MQHEQEQVKGESSQRVRRWGRERGEETKESAAYVAAPAIPLPRTTPDRFRPGGLRPAEEPRRRTAPRLPQWLRPATALDRVLLGVEIAGALVVAWVVWQYLYTTYFDTGPKRLTPGIVATTPTRARTPAAPTPTATRFVEVLPPEVGGPEVGGPDGTTTPTRARSTATPTPTVASQLLLPTRLRIPVMFLDSPVHEVRMNMEEWEVSPMDVGHHEGTGVPGEPGNVVLAAHRDVNSALFRELDRLVPGDDVFVSNALGEHRYVVSDVMEVSPNHTEVMDPTDDKRVTLITCTPVGLATRRLVVVAVMEE